MLSKNAMSMSHAVCFTGFALLCALQGCAAFVPFIEPDAQAKLNGAQRQHVATEVSYEAGTPLRSRRPTGHGDLQVRELTQRLGHPKPAVRVNAATDLGYLGKRAKPAVPALIASLRDEHYWVRRASAKSLGRLRAKEAVPELRRCLNDHDRYVAMSAQKAITQIVN